MTIFHQVVAALGDHLYDRGVCWLKSGIDSASRKQVSCNLMEIVGDPTYVEDIWSELVSVGTNHGAGAGATAAGREN